jgi:hypothetical protein
MISQKQKEKENPKSSRMFIMTLCLPSVSKFQIYVKAWPLWNADSENI